MLFWVRAIIPVEFRYIRRYVAQTVLSEKIQFQRKARSRHGYLIAYIIIETERYLL